MAKFTLIDQALQKQAQLADNAAFNQPFQFHDKLSSQTKNHNTYSDEEINNSDQDHQAVVDKLDLTGHANDIMNDSRIRKELRRGRGSALNPKGRFETYSTENVSDEWETEIEKISTEVLTENPRSIISRNTSPDIPFEQSVNPYRGCEHGCIYCYARPSHSYMGYSAGLDFETRLFAKPNAAMLLRQELCNPNYKPKTIALGSNTDPYQPIEKHYKLTRAILETLSQAQHPVCITTKSALILRDSDILAKMAQNKLVHVALSVESLDPKLIRSMDPRAVTPKRRLQVIDELSNLGIPVSVMVAPVIPALNDHEIEHILTKVAQAGAITANYAVLRLPYEVAPLFKEWLLREYPDKYRRVVGQIRTIRGGKENETNTYERMYGQGVMAKLLARRFQLAVERNGLNKKSIHLSRRFFAVPEEWRHREGELLLSEASLQQNGNKRTLKKKTKSNKVEKLSDKKDIQLALF